MKGFKLGLLLVAVLLVPGIWADSDREIKDESGHEAREGRRKQGRMGRMGNLRGSGKMMEQQMQSFLESLKEEDREHAQKIVNYLHTSHQVAKHHMKNNEFEQASAILEKRLRLKVPAYFDQAPPMLKGYKLHTRVELGKLYLDRKDYTQAIRHLELAYEESKKEKDFPTGAQQGIQAQLIRAYNKAGMNDKAQSLLQTSLKSAEQGLNFE